jgi:hypothetical protein
MLLALPLLAMGFTACHETRTPQGKIPAQYVYQAHQYQGSYIGHFRGEPTRVGLYMNEDQPYVVVENQQNNDLIGASCGSSVGLLNSVKGSQNSYGYEVLQNAKFDFNAGQCGGAQQVLKMDFSADQLLIRARLQDANAEDDDKDINYYYDGEFVRE